MLANQPRARAYQNVAGGTTRRARAQLRGGTMRQVVY